MAEAVVSLRAAGALPRGPSGQAAPVSANTDAQGRFALEAPPGRYTLAATKAGFVPQQYGASPDAPPTPLVLESGRSQEGLTIRLTPAASLSGRITDAEGGVLANAEVTAFRYTYTRGRRQLTPAGYTIRTGSGGEFLIPNLTPGRYYLRLEGPRQDPQRPLSGTIPVATYYPGVTDPLAAAAIDLAPGEQRRGVDIRQRNEQVFAIRGGAIEALTGAPALNAALTIRREGDPETLTPPPRVPTRAPDGSFEFTGLTAGAYIIQAIPNGVIRGANGEPIPARYSGRTAVLVAREDVTGLVLRVDSGAALAGRLVMDDGSPLPTPPSPAPAPAPGLVAAAGLRVSLVDAEQTFTPGNLAAQPASEGGFRIEAIPPAKYYVSVQPLPPDMFVKSMRAGSLDVTRAPLDLTSGGPATLEIVLSAKGGVVSGVVRGRDGGAIPRIAVALWPEVPDLGNPASGVRTTATDDNGAFRFTGLRPERYRAAAFEGVDRAFLRSPDFLGRFNAKSKDLTVTENAQLEASLEPVSRAESEAVIRMLP